MQSPEPKRVPTTALLPIEAALERMLAAISPLSTESLPLLDTLGRVLATDLVADIDQPSYDRAMMDGFAVRGVDCESGSVDLECIGEAPAGHRFDGVVGAGQCVRIMTGGIVPEGADSVVAIERTEARPAAASDGGAPTWRVLERVRRGQHVALRGCEVSAGDVVVSAGSPLDGARIGTAASFGRTHIEVFRQPRVVVIPTGSEIIPIDGRPKPGEVRNSNSYALSALARRCGGQVRREVAVVDDKRALAEVLTHARDTQDVIVTCGGVSMGDYDLVASTLLELGAEVHFHRVRLKPGKPVLCASLGGTLVVGLPGNPVSAYVCGLLFMRPALAALQGGRRRSWTRVRMPLLSALPATKGREVVVPARLCSDPQGSLPDGVVAVQLAGSADLAHFAARDLLIIRPPHASAAERGDSVDVLTWPQPA